jgi:HK97 family phage major capsid protein
VGKTATSQTAITADELMDLYHALPYMYRQNAVWMMNDTTAAQLRKLREDGASGNYLWQPGLLAGQPDTLLGRPVYTNNSMDTPAAGKKVVLFGDLSYYWISDFGGVSMKRLDELYAANGQVGFRFFRRVDARVMVAEAIQLLQMAA